METSDCIVVKTWVLPVMKYSLSTKYGAESIHSMVTSDTIRRLFMKGI
jgi:hypothetical protein